jgi:hypothetical protein
MWISNFRHLSNRPENIMPQREKHQNSRTEKAIFHGFQCLEMNLPKFQGFQSKGTTL